MHITEIKLARIIAATMMITSLIPASPAHAIGLAARFGDVVVENAEIGKTYNLREAARVPFGVENRGKVPVDVTVQFEAPNLKTIISPYEAIPDPTWLKSFPERVTIGPKSIGYFDLLLNIPNDPSLNGRHFQAIVKARTVDTGLLGLAVENRLRFSIGPGPETLEEEKRLKAMAQLDFNVSPQTIYITDVPIGKVFDVKEEQKKVIRVSNYSMDPLPIKLSSELWDTRLYKPGDYEPIPDPSWIVIKTAEKKIGPEEIESFSFKIKIPNEEQYRGKKFAAIIKTGLDTGFWLDAPVKIFM